MSKIATGVRFTDRQSHKGYGYLAIFSDGDVRRHTTDFKKTHCVRVKIGSFMKWDDWRIVPGAEVRDGMQLREVRFGQFQYEWFTNEAEAVREIRKAASMTIRPWLGMRHHGGAIHPLNEPFADTPYYEAIEIVEPRTVWERPAGVDTLAALNDPRIKVSTPAMVARALAELAARARATSRRRNCRMSNRLPYTTGDAVADLHRIATERKATTWARGAMLICFEAERKAGVPLFEAFNEALAQIGRQTHGR